MMGTVRAELFLLSRTRTAVWVGLAWVAMAVVFGIVIPVIVHAAIGDHPTASVPDPTKLLDGIRPANIMATTTGLYPIYGAALMLVLGAVVMGADFRYQTWSTLFVLEPRRGRVVVAKIAALAVVAVVITIASVAVMTCASLVAASALHLGTGLPSMATVLAGTGACCLVSIMAACLGAFAAVAFRGVTMAVALGLVWMLAVENLMASLSGVSPVFEHVRAAFPGGAAGSLMSSFSGGTDKLPGVAHLESVELAVAVIVTYLALSVGMSTLQMRRRDAL